jgi:proteasome lid subunit RPN8/RPN11
MRRVTVTLPAAVRRAILAHARRDAPRECCGLLLGRGNRVLHAAAMRNVASTPRVRFRIDPREHIALRRELRRLSPALEIVGVYHSHPVGPAGLSARDRREAHYREWLYVLAIGGPDRFRLRAYRIDRRSASPS